MDVEQLDIDAIELIAGPRYSLKEFQSIFNKQDAVGTLVVDEKFPLVLSAEIYSFLVQPRKKEIDNIRQMVFMQVDRIQKKILRSVELPIDVTPIPRHDSTIGFWIFDWRTFGRILQADINLHKISGTILEFISKWKAYQETAAHSEELILKRQEEAARLHRQEAAYQQNMDRHDSSLSVYIPARFIPTPAPSRQAIKPLSRNAFQSPPRKKRKIINKKSKY